MVIEIPGSHTAEVTAVRFPRLQVEMLEDVLNVIPILHKERISVVNNDQFDRRQKIVISLLLTITASAGTPKRGGTKLTQLDP